MVVTEIYYTLPWLGAVLRSPAYGSANGNLFSRSRKMSKYEQLMEQADKAIERAAHEQDYNLKVFYLNASKGFVIKAMKLTIEEAMEVVE